MASASDSPSMSPSASPSGSPSKSPSGSPSSSPSVSPSASPSEGPVEQVWAAEDTVIRGVMVVKWENLNVNGNPGRGCLIAGYEVQSVQVLGTFGGATLTMQGSDMVEDPTYANLNDKEGDALAFASAAIKSCLEGAYWIRPLLSSAGSTTDLDVYVLLSKIR